MIAVGLGDVNWGIPQGDQGLSPRPLGLFKGEVHWDALPTLPADAPDLPEMNYADLAHILP
jgi:hypothetical protein